MLLGEFLHPEADLNNLVCHVMNFVNKQKPIQCETGWGGAMNSTISNILAGVFALFTILKSGASYHRIETADGVSDLGNKLLMKPHNIQVLTLLNMFGCASTVERSLESQLMQIRTGEGKSMIMGAASTMLGLLGFNVRCVCYSEYLSNRDFRLFEDVFSHFNLMKKINYSKITRFSEDKISSKGNIRNLTESLIHGQVVNHSEVSNRLCPETSNCAIYHTVHFEEGSNSNQKEFKKSAKRLKSSRDHDYIGEEINDKSMCTIADERVNSAANVNCSEEILLVDEVDVFFGSDFYGQTYNQVAQLKEPEVAVILKEIWKVHQSHGRRLYLHDVKVLPAYKSLVQKFPRYTFLLDNEISLMLDQVRRVDDEPYFLDKNNGRIGYFLMDSISYEATYGYRTVFAYLKEADEGNLINKNETLARVLTMPVSCGQFSYANINPKRILGVSGTLKAMGSYERDTLKKYGIEKFVYVPSVYGTSNFQFDKAGDGIFIEASVSDFYHIICEETIKATKMKRAVIIFFQNNSKLKDFTSSQFYRKLGRQKNVLTEDLSATDKEFIICRAAFAGQITVSSAVFGRGTDFFSKDQRVQENGGVHVIQTFLSEEHSEEIQIQGRTARQGKRGSYQMVLLEKDLEDHFQIVPGLTDRIAKQDIYKYLSDARDKHRNHHFQMVESNLRDATEKDKKTHEYFDALLDSDEDKAHILLEDIYLSMKRPRPEQIDIDFAFVIDVTGSMRPYMTGISSVLKSMLHEGSSIERKLVKKYPEVKFNIRVGSIGYRDIDDKNDQFQESITNEGCHFSSCMDDVIGFIETITENATGGFDLAEDHLGVIHRCGSWDHPSDWTAAIKCMILFTDAPAHSMSPQSNVQNADNYAVRHPLGLTSDIVVQSLIEKDIDFFFCSFNPSVTSSTEENLARDYLNHPKNKEKREITVIPMVSEDQTTSEISVTVRNKHVIFVLDESGSMAHDWAGVEKVYNNFMTRRQQNQVMSDIISVVQFDSNSRVTVQNESISTASRTLSYSGGGTCFHPAAKTACRIARETMNLHDPLIVFMSDGGTGARDATAAAAEFSSLRQEIMNLHNNDRDLELHVIAFGSGNMTQLREIANASGIGKVYASADTADLSDVFVSIATGADVASLVETEIGKRISDVVADRLSLEFMAYDH